MASTLELWLKRHAAGETTLAGVLDKFFRGQVQRVLDGLADFDSPTVADVATVFDRDDEHELLMQAVGPKIAKLVVASSLTELERYSPKRKAACRVWRKTFEVDGEMATDLPQALANEIRAALSELEEQPYWKEIQAGTEARLKTIIGEGIEDGLSGGQLAKKIREALGGAAAKVRANAIARTETTGAMNAGHDATLVHLEEEGIIEGKTWLSIIDNDTRESHADLNDTTISAAEEFSVGGSRAPYPGHYSLPPEERINCRCTVVGKVSVD